MLSYLPELRVQRAVRLRGCAMGSAQAYLTAVKMAHSFEDPANIAAVFSFRA